MTYDKYDALSLSDHAWNFDGSDYGTDARRMNAYMLCLLQDCAEMIRGQHAEIESLRERAAARAPAESVRRDAERLDFIERHPEMSLRHHKGEWAFLDFTNYEYDLHPSLRAAIDAAMAANGGNK